MKLPKLVRAVTAITLFLVFIPFLVLSAVIKLNSRKRQRMNWFYFRDYVTGVQVRWDREDRRVRIIDPVSRVIVNETDINLVRVIRTCSTYLNKKIDLEGDDE